MVHSFEFRSVMVVIMMQANMYLSENMLHVILILKINETIPGLSIGIENFTCNLRNSV